jgi:hypothetical protein
MRYYIDTEFDGFRGPLISMALIREDGRSLYFIIEGAEDACTDPWVIDNVLPILKDSPEPPWVLDDQRAAEAIYEFIRLDRDNDILFVADWPDDIAHLCRLLHFAPGEMIRTPPVVRFEVRRVDAWPCELPGLTQHCAWADAVALRHKLQGPDE